MRMRVTFSLYLAAFGFVNKFPMHHNDFVQAKRDPLHEIKLVALK